MLIILLIVFFIFLLTAYLLFDKDVLSPSFILFCSFFIGCLFANIGNLFWQEEISSRICTIFIVGNFFFVLGELYARFIFENCSTIETNIIQVKPIFRRIHTVRLLLFVLVQAVILFLFYKRLTEMVMFIGYAGENFLKYSRSATIDAGLTLGTFFSFFICILYSGSCVSAFILIKNFYSFPRIEMHKSFLLYCSVFIGVFACLLSGAKYALLQLFSVIGLSYLYYSIQSKEYIFKVVFKVVSLFFIIIFVCALLLVFRSGLTSVDFKEVLNFICIYIGSPVVAFDQWLENGITSTWWGEETFWGIRRFLNGIMSTIQKTSQFDKTVVFRDGSSTNIYTAYKSFFSDFGWLGMICIPFILGLMYTLFYKIAVSKKTDVLLLSYAFFTFYLIFMMFTPAVTSNLFTSSQIMGMFWLVIIERWLHSN